MKILQYPAIPQLTNYGVLMETWYTAELIARRGLTRVLSTSRDSALPSGSQGYISRGGDPQEKPIRDEKPRREGSLTIRETAIRHNSHCPARIRTRRAMKGSGRSGARAGRCWHRTAVRTDPVGAGRALPFRADRTGNLPLRS